MLKKIAKMLPRKTLVSLYRKLPLSIGVKRRIVYCANERFLVAVLGIIMNDDRKVLLLKHTYRRAEPWGLPSGYIEKEDPNAGLQREIFEETSFTVEIGQIIYTGYADNPPRINLYFSGRITSGEFKSCEEISECDFFDIKDLPGYMPNYEKELIRKVLNHDCPAANGYTDAGDKA